MFNNRWAGGAAALAIAASLTPAAHAQFTSSEINGQVIDGNGNPVANVVVTITDERTGRTSRATTSNRGVFFESGLSVGGPYTIEATTPTGVARREGVRLQPSSNSITLFAEAEDVVIVRGQRVDRLDLNNGVGSVFGEDDIANTPTVQRDLIATLNRDPLAQSGGEGNLSVAGANPRFNGLAINGALLQDDFGLSDSTYPTARSPINLDAIESASLVASDYSVFASGFTGGLVNVVTKSGTNEFSGTGFYYYRNEDFNGNAADGNFVEQPDFDEKEYGFTVGGPIIKDKLFFFVSYDEFETSDTRNFTESDENGGRDQRLFDGLNQLVLDTYGLDLGGRPVTVGAPQTSERLLATIDWNITDEHRAQFTYQSTEEGGLTSISPTEFRSAWYDAPQEVDVYTAQLFSDWTPNLSTQVRVNYKDNTRGQICGNPDAGELQFRLSEDDLVGTDFEGFIDGDEIGGSDNEVFLTGSCDRFRHANEFDDERLQVLARADYTWQDHQFSAGVEYENYELFNLFVERSNGQFIFDTIEDIENRTAEVSYRNSPTNDANDAAAEWGLNKWSFSASDRWQIIPELSVNYGIRYEYYSQDEQPIDSAGFESTYGFSSAQNLDGLDIVMPRVGFEYEPFARTKVTGGFGLFAGGDPKVWVSNSFQGLISGVDGEFPDVDPFTVPQALQDELAEVTQDTFVPIDVISPDFEIPSDWKASLRVDQAFDMDFTKWGVPVDLGTDYQFSVQWLRTETNNGFLWRNIAQTQLAATQPTGVAPDGRPIYADLQDLGISNVVALDNFDEGVSNVFTVSLAKEYENGFGFQLSYAHQNIEAVTEGTSSRGISNWRGIGAVDRNFPEVGTSPFQVEHAFKIFLDYETEIFGDLKSSFSLFGDIQSGSTFFSTFNVNPDNSLFGRAGDFESPFDNNPLYIPSGVSDPNVVFASDFDTDAFFAQVDARGYGTGIVDRYGDEGPWNQFWDFHFEQELPFADFGYNRFEGNKLKFVLDIENIGNFLNDEWGLFRTGPGFGQEAVVSADLVSAADVAANGIDAATALEGDLARTTCTTAEACVYRYNDFDFDPTGNLSRNASTYSARIGIRYEF